MFRSIALSTTAIVLVQQFACSDVNTSQTKSETPKPVHRFLHWNIKELDSTKVASYQTAEGLTEGERAALNSSTRDKWTQVKAAGKLLGDLKPELLSLNEIQYDVDKSERSSSFCDFSQVVAERKRLEIIQNQDFILDLAYPGETWSTTFCPANTGARAKRFEENFLSDRPNESDPEFVRKDNQIDKVNFGWTPGQYSTVFASRLPILDRSNIASITWAEWDPTLDIKRFDLGFSNINYRDKTLTDEMIAAQALAANLAMDNYKTYQLFDKNFNVSKIEIDGRTVNVVTFHTVPAFGFDREGKSVNPNPLRNSAQLEFLEWFLLGSCDATSPSAVRRCETALRPLEAGESFIAVGDLNVAIDSPVYPGSKVLQRILTHGAVANSQMTDRKFGLPIIPEQNLPAEVLNKMQNGGLAPEDFGGFHPYTTFIPSGFDFRGRGRSKTEQLDYFIVSADLKIHRLETYFINPEFKDFGCLAAGAETDLLIQNEKAAGRAVDILNKDIRDKVSNAIIGRQTCVKSATAAYGALRDGSDHLPIILEFSVKD